MYTLANTMGVSVVAAMYGHSVVSIAIWVGLGTLLAVTQDASHRPSGLRLLFCNEPSPTQMAVDTAEWTYIATTTESSMIKSSINISQCIHILFNV